MVHWVLKSPRPVTLGPVPYSRDSEPTAFMYIKVRLQPLFYATSLTIFYSSKGAKAPPRPSTRLLLDPKRYIRT